MCFLNFKAIYSFILLFFLLAFQEALISQHSDFCGFEHKRHQKLLDPNFKTKADAIEHEIQKFSTSNNIKSSHQVYKIPVVVHVLHLGEAIGVSHNISDAQIQSAISNLNQTYRGQTPTSPIDFEIEFALAQQDPNCNPTNGINRIDASSVPNYSTGGVDYYDDGGEADENTLKDLSRWPETDYFNIWIITEIENNNGGFGIQGYANFFTGGAYEGSMMMYNVFGYDPTNQQPGFSLKGARDNSTVVHEFGHYLHLHHTFKGDNDANQDGIGDNCPADATVGVDSDGCSDTEPHKRHTSQCWSGQTNDCTNATFNDNTAKNFMSYASCMDRLTNDQRTRARAMLATTGISLIYSKGDETPTSYSGTLTNANCSPQTTTGLSGSYTGIQNLTIDGIFSNTSSWSDIDGGYLDNTTNCQKIINIYEDSTYNFSISTFYYGNNIKGYIDFNNDGDFNDANEQILDLNTLDNLSSPYISSIATNVTIPSINSSSILGETPLRLRLNADPGNVTGPCYAPTYGQVEDYLLIINQVITPCNAPISLNASNITPSSADLSWVAGGTETNWELTWGLQGFSTSSGTLVPMLNTNTYSLTGISANTSYDFYVKADCGFGTGFSNLSTWAGPFNFTTSSSCSPTFSTDTQSACDNFTWIDGNNYNSNNNSATFVLINAAGCDSTITLDLTINNSPTINIGSDTTICDTSSLILDAGASFISYSWNNGSTDQTYTVNNNGIYYVTISDINGCSASDTISISTTNCNTICNAPNSLNATNISSTSADLSWIAGGTETIWELTWGIQGFSTGSGTLVPMLNSNLYNLGGLTANTTYDYYVKADCGLGTGSSNLSTWAGPFSFTTLNTGCITTYSTDSQTACNSLTWMDGITYTSNNNTATYTLANAAGCDSVITLNLTITNSSSSTDSQTACNSLTWIDGITYTTNNNTATHVIANSVGCDSTITLNLTIGGSSTGTDFITACDSLTWIDGITYSATNNTASHTISNNVGCDSIINLNLTINNSNFITDTHNACNSFTWMNGVTYTSNNNIATYSISNIFGCDSVIQLNLTIDPSYNVVDSITSCDQYLWNGNNYSSSGIYIDSSNTINTCDSVSTLFLTINSSYTDTNSIIACDNFTWEGSNYSTSGLYNKLYSSSLGCDSILYLNLTLNYSYSDTINNVSCDTFAWSNQTYNQSGLYVDSNFTINGCDSLKFLNLIINSSYNDTINVASCDTFVWDSVNYTSSGIYTNNYSSINGCDSIVTLELSINSNIGTPLSLELILDDFCLETYWLVKDSQGFLWYNEGPYNCDPNGGGTQANDTIQKDIYLPANECYTFQLHDHYGDGMSASIWGGTNGSWTLTDINGGLLMQGSGNFGDSIYADFFVDSAIPSSIIEYDLSRNISVYPNPLSTSAQIKVEGESGPFNVAVYDITGKIVLSLSSEKENQFEINTQHLSSGIYWLLIKNKPILQPIKLVIE